MEALGFLSARAAPGLACYKPPGNEPGDGRSVCLFQIKNENKVEKKSYLYLSEERSYRLNLVLRNLKIVQIMKR